MKAYLQKIAAGPSSFAAFVRNDPAFPFRLALSPGIRIDPDYGQSWPTAGGRWHCRLQPGDLVLLGPNVPHSWRSGPMKSETSRRHRAVVIQFRHDFLGEQFFKLKEMEVRRPFVGSLRQWSCVRSYRDRPQTCRLHRRASLITAGKTAGEITVCAGGPGERERRVGFVDVEGETYLPGADQQRIDAVCLYLNEHFGEEIDFSELAARLHMDQASLCRFFKRATGRTMTAYLNELRVGAAAQLLIETDKSVLEIGFRVGFGNLFELQPAIQKDQGLWPADTSAAIFVRAIRGESVHGKSSGVAGRFARQKKRENGRTGRPTELALSIWSGSSSDGSIRHPRLCL